MKLLLYILLLSGINTIAFSQVPIIRRMTPTGTASLPKAQRDTIIEKLKDLSRKSQPSVDNMPNAFNTKPLQPVYETNNGNGFDIYRSEIDNMAILMPDSLNAVSLRNGANNANIPNPPQFLNNSPKTYPVTPVQPKIFRIPK